MSVYSRAITSVRATYGTDGEGDMGEGEEGGRRFNIPTVYSSGSVDIGCRRKITSILVNIPPLHARNNARDITAGPAARAASLFRVFPFEKPRRGAGHPEDEREGEKVRRSSVARRSTLIVAVAFNSLAQICSRM